MINFIITTLFVIFMIFTVVGFNRQMMEKNSQRDEKRKNFEEKKLKDKNYKKDENESVD